MNQLSLLVLIVAASLQVTVGQGSFSSNSDRASFILSALCLQDGGRISQACINGLSSRDLYRTLIAAIPPPRRMDSLSSKGSEESGKLSLPDKRGREENSGFYSNW